MLITSELTNQSERKDYSLVWYILSTVSVDFYSSLTRIMDLHEKQLRRMTFVASSLNKYCNFFYDIQYIIIINVQITSVNLPHDVN